MKVCGKCHCRFHNTLKKKKKDLLIESNQNVKVRNQKQCSLSMENSTIKHGKTTI